MVLHAEHDLIQVFQQDAAHHNEYAALGAVSDSLVCSALTLGLQRVPRVLRQGIETSVYDMPIPERLRTVGYAANMKRLNQWGTLDIKRGHLVEAAAEAAGLEFKVAVGVSRDKMPDFYRSVDALVMSSLQEGGAMPPYEGAASGRLVIGTPVGDFPQLVLKGMGLLAPLNDDHFLDFTTSTLKLYRDDHRAFQQKCAAIRFASRARSWDAVIEDWRAFTGSTGREGSGIFLGRDTIDPRGV